MPGDVNGLEHWVAVAVAIFVLSSYVSVYRKETSLSNPSRSS